MSVGKNIKKIRSEKKLTQRQLGELSGISYKQIGLYEQGKRNPKIETIEKISNALGVTVAEIKDYQEILDNDDFEELETFRKVDRKQEEEKFNTELHKRGIYLMYELLTTIYSKKNGKYHFNVNDIDGLNVFKDFNLEEYQTLSNNELKELEEDILNYLEFQFEKEIKDKPVNKRKD